MTLREKQSLFARLVGELLGHITELGHEVTFGEAYRTPEQAALNARMNRGIRNSLHCSRLAIDLNLFVDGAWMTSTEAWREIGEWWETRHPLCRWGGRFGDGNHFSLEHEGRR